MGLIYLDNAASTALDPAVREAMRPYLEEEFGNPSSRHPLGVRAADAVEDARGRIARVLGTGEDTVVFTSGGTEANNLAVLGLARAARRKGRHILIGSTEHPSVRAAALALTEEGFEVETTTVAPRAGLDLEDLERRLRPDTVVVAQMLVNNEFGSVYPVPSVARVVRARAPQAVLHVDAVQGLGKLALSLGELGADSMAISAHKIHGPKGNGALVLAPGVRPRPLVHGGGQEGGLRPGTENVAGVVGLGRAVELAVETQPAAAPRMHALRELLADELARHLAGARVLAADGGAGVSPAVAAVELPGAPAEVWMHHLEARGIHTSVGSACQAKARELSPALIALGLSEEEARRVLRVSFSRHTLPEEVRAAVAALAALERELAPAAGRR